MILASIQGCIFLHQYCNCQLSCLGKGICQQPTLQLLLWQYRKSVTIFARNFYDGTFSLFVKYTAHGLTLMSRSDSSHPAPRSLNVRWNLGLSPSTRFCRWNLRPVQSSFRNTMESPSPAALVGTSAAGATENTHLRPVLLRDLDPQYGRGSSSEPVAHFLLGRG